VCIWSGSWYLAVADAVAAAFSTGEAGDFGLPEPDLAGSVSFSKARFCCVYIELDMVDGVDGFGGGDLSSRVFE
jgi:hypothetical protein